MTSILILQPLRVSAAILYSHMNLEVEVTEKERIIIEERDRLRKYDENIKLLEAQTKNLERNMLEKDKIKTQEKENSKNKGEIIMNEVQDKDGCIESI
jgi:hypothetical protein